MDSNRNKAITFLQKASGGQVDEAFALTHPSFRHHNPYFAGNANAVKQGMREAALQHPQQTLTVQRSLVDGDLVAVHSKVQPTPALSVSAVHLFRFEDGLIAELWDVAQAVPAEAENEKGMF